MDEWVATQYKHEDDVEDPHPNLIIESTTSSSYEGVKWAVRFAGQCLSVKGRWEYEPQPSSRSDSFLRRFRFDDLEQAKEAAKKARISLISEGFMKLGERSEGKTS